MWNIYIYINIYIYKIQLFQLYFMATYTRKNWNYFSSFPNIVNKLEIFRSSSHQMGWKVTLRKVGWKVGVREVSWTKEKSLATNIHLFFFFSVLNILKRAEIFDNLVSTHAKRQLFLNNLEILMSRIILVSAGNLIQVSSWQPSKIQVSHALMHPLQ